MTSEYITVLNEFFSLKNNEYACENAFLLSSMIVTIMIMMSLVTVELARFQLPASLPRMYEHLDVDF